MSTAPLTQPSVPVDLRPNAAVEPAARPRPRLPWPARVIATMVAMVVAALSALPLLVIPGAQDFLASASPGTAVTARAAIGALMCTAYLLLGWALMRGIDRRPFRDLGLAVTPRAVLGLIAGIGIALVATVGGTALVQALGLGRPAEQAWSTGGVALPLVILAVLIPAFLVQGIGEEVLFRGYLLRSLPHRPAVAVVISAVAFGALHLISRGGQQSLAEHIWYLAIPTGFAIAAGFLALRLGTTWAAIGIHGGMHVATAVAGAIGLTADGPVVWVAIGALFALIGAMVHVLPRRRSAVPGTGA